MKNFSGDQFLISMKKIFNGPLAPPSGRVGDLYMKVHHGISSASIWPTYWWHHNCTNYKLYIYQWYFNCLIILYQNTFPGESILQFAGSKSISSLTYEDKISGYYTILFNFCVLSIAIWWSNLLIKLIKTILLMAAIMTLKYIVQVELYILRP